MMMERKDEEEEEENGKTINVHYYRSSIVVEINLSIRDKI